MITITTLKIMTPHERTVETVNDLIDHLEHIGYLVVQDARKSAEGVRLEGQESWSDEYPYIISQHGRAHRITFDSYNDAARFEDLADEMEIQPA